MGNFTKYIIILGIILILFRLTGVTEKTHTNALLQLLEDPKQLIAGNYWLDYGGKALWETLFTLAGIGAVIAGAVYYRDPRLIIMAALMPLFISWFSAIYEIWQKVNGFSPEFALIFISPIILTGMLALLDYWGTQQ